MHGTSDDTFWARRCVSCNETIPLKEVICYCGGPVMIIKVPKDKENFVSEYYYRRMMDKLKRGY